MQNLNRTLLTGNLTRDPELKTTTSGLVVCNMRLAVNGRIKRDGEWVDKPNFFNVVAFGAQGENCNKYLSKGDPIAVDGRLDWREWTTDGGDRREAVQVMADSVQFLERPGGSTTADERAPSSTPVSVGGAAADEDDIPF